MKHLITTALLALILIGCIPPRSDIVNPSPAPVDPVVDPLKPVPQNVLADRIRAALKGDKSAADKYAAYYASLASLAREDEFRTTGEFEVAIAGMNRSLGLPGLLTAIVAERFPDKPEGPMTDAVRADLELGFVELSAACEEVAK